MLKKSLCTFSILAKLLYIHTTWEWTVLEWHHALVEGINWLTKIAETIIWYFANLNIFAKYHPKSCGCDNIEITYTLPYRAQFLFIGDAIRKMSVLDFPHVFSFWSHCLWENSAISCDIDIDSCFAPIAAKNLYWMKAKYRLYCIRLHYTSTQFRCIEEMGKKRPAYHFAKSFTVLMFIWMKLIWQWIACLTH